jgi:hypothetical protein
VLQIGDTAPGFGAETPESPLAAALLGWFVRGCMTRVSIANRPDHRPVNTTQATSAPSNVTLGAAPRPPPE